MGVADKIKVGGREYELAPLSFKALKVHKEVIRQMTQGEATTVDELYDAMASLVHASISRDHPDVTRDMVEESLDWPKSRVAVDVVLKLSFPQPPAGETAAESPSGTSTSTPA